MLKRDRTDEERQIDKLTQRAIMALGTQPARAAIKPNPYPYILLWDREGRKGQRCKLVKRGRVVVLEFPDGFRLAINAMAIRRDKSPCQDARVRKT